MTKRSKKPVLEIPNEGTAKELLKAYSDAVYKETELQGKIEQEIAKVRERYKEPLLQLQLQKEESFIKVQLFAEKHKEEMFSKKKSVDWAHGIIGFRLGTYKVKARAGFTLKSALTLMKNFELPFIRVKEEIDKEKIIALREDEEQMNLIETVGLYVDQDETFYIEPKRETV